MKVEEQNKNPKFANKQTNKQTNKTTTKTTNKQKIQKTFSIGTLLYNMTNIYGRQALLYLFYFHAVLLIILRKYSFFKFRKITVHGGSLNK